MDGDLESLKSIDSHGQQKALHFDSEKKAASNSEEHKQVKDSPTKKDSDSKEEHLSQDKGVKEDSVAESNDKKEESEKVETEKENSDVNEKPAEEDEKAEKEEKEEKELDNQEQISSHKKNVSQILVTDLVFLDIKIGEEQVGRIEIGLFGKATPNTTANFKGLCEGFTDKSGKIVTYKGTKFHRVIKDFMIQGGQIPGGTSIFGGNFADENFDVKFHGLGWVAMANAGKDTNKTQFFITTSDTWYLNGKTVVFGKVIKGMSIVDKIQNVKRGKNDRPEAPQEVLVTNSGSLETEPFLTDETDAVN